MTPAVRRVFNPVFVIVLAQLFGTSLWFSANSAADNLTASWGLQAGDLGTLTNAVQLGFILGTLGFAITGLADRSLDAAFDKAAATLADSLRFTRVAKLDRGIFATPAMVPLSVTPIVMAVRDNLRNYGAAQFEQPDWTIVGFTDE